jgi:hypothetical protein
MLFPSWFWPIATIGSSNSCEVRLLGMWAFWRIPVSENLIYQVLTVPTGFLNQSFADGLKASRSPVP